MAVSPGGRPADASPLGTPGGRQNWVDKTGGLPTYIREVAHALKRKHPEWTMSHCIAVAKNAMTKWAAKSKNPNVKSAAARADATFNAKAAAARMSPNLSSDQEAAVELSWNAAAHPRGKAGSGQGGEFVPLQYHKAADKGTGYRKAKGGHRVRRLQRALNRLGVKDKNGRALAVDGKFGPKTASAVRRWQRRHGQKPTGVVGKAAFGKLKAAGRKAGTTHEHSRQGDAMDFARGDDTETAVHKRLVKKGFPVHLAAKFAKKAAAKKKRASSKSEHSRDTGNAVDLAGKWRHGYVPLDMQAALSKAHGSRKGASKYLGGGAGKKVKKGTFYHGPKSATSSNVTKLPTRINRVEAAARMFGVGSKQHKAAIKKYGKGGGPSVQHLSNGRDIDASQLVELATLTAKKRKKLPKSAFALPGGKYPIHDKSHARNALARVAQHGTPEQKAKVRKAVARKFKGLGK